MNTTEKFFIYIVDANHSVDRLWTDTVGVLSILNNRGKGMLSVIRPSTNQTAYTLGDSVGWQDIGESDSKSNVS